VGPTATVFAIAAAAGAVAATAEMPAAPVVPDPAHRADLANQARSAEIAFAKTMAARDHDAFASHVADEALFFGRKGVLRGKAAVAAGWKPFFEGGAPFSWSPETVEVLASGTLAHSSGPVRDPAGRQIGTFNSIWRREADGSAVVFDKDAPRECPPSSDPVSSERTHVEWMSAEGAPHDLTDPVYPIGSSRCPQVEAGERGCSSIRSAAPGAPRGRDSP
jgi:ketosteroid isomerase-like protein